VPITRAIAVFLENQQHFIIQARGLYASWNAVKVERLPIDLLIFTKHGTKLGDDVKCSAYTYHNNQNDCFVIELTKEEEVATAKIIGTADREQYGFVKSIDFLLNIKARFVLQYTYLMKTDLDTFITPAFARWIPQAFFVGKAAYAHMFDTQRDLHSWAEKLGYKHRGLHNLGATWYGDPHIILEAARIAANVTMVMHRKAFVESVKNQGWPRWHKGVSSMYGQEIAINVVVPEAEPTQLIDHPSQESSSINKIYHIHCWQGDAFFSKHAFQAGWYDNLNTTHWNTADTRIWSLIMMQMATKKISFDVTLSTYPEPVGTITPNFIELAKKPTTKTTTITTTTTTKIEVQRMTISRPVSTQAKVKNYIFGIASGYDLPTISKFVTSARKFGYKDDIWLGVLASVSQEVREFSRINKVILKSVDLVQHKKIMIERYILYQEWASVLAEDDWILMTDVRDTFFQRSPFEFFFKRQMTAPVNLFYEHWDPPIGSAAENTIWLERCWGRSSISPVRNNSIICGCNMMGRVKELREVFIDILMTARTVPHCRDLYGSDQAILNWLYYINDWKNRPNYVKVWRQGDGPVNTLQHMTPKLNSQGLVINNDGSLAALVHWYDRYPELSKTFDNLLRSSPRPSLSRPPTKQP
jgi:hypothetical protein